MIEMNRVRGGVGASPLKIDARAKVTGVARYPDDLAPVDALWAKVVMTGRPHARLLSASNTLG